MRKYLTVRRIPISSCSEAPGSQCFPTIIDLLKRHDRVGRQALLGVLVKQEGLGCHGALLLLGGGRWHGGLLLRVGVHDEGGVASRAAMARGAGRGAPQSQTEIRGAGAAAVSVNLVRPPGWYSRADGVARRGRTRGGQKASSERVRAKMQWEQDRLAVPRDEAYRSREGGTDVRGEQREGARMERKRGGGGGQQSVKYSETRGQPSQEGALGRREGKGEKLRHPQTWR